MFLSQILGSSKNVYADKVQGTLSLEKNRGELALSGQITIEKLWEGISMASSNMEHVTKPFSPSRAAALLPSARSSREDFFGSKKG